MKPVLFIFSGLPASGKSTLAQYLAKEYPAVYLRIDTIEQALKELCHFDVQGEGYRLAYLIAADNLKLGLNVIADSCNPITLTRDEWQQVAVKNDSRFVDIEIVCSDKEEHRKRVETRLSEVKNLVLPEWEQVENREYYPWQTDRVVVDTAGKSADESRRELITKVKDYLTKHL